MGSEINIETSSNRQRKAYTVVLNEWPDGAVNLKIKTPPLLEPAVATLILTMKLGHVHSVIGTVEVDWGNQESECLLSPNDILKCAPYCFSTEEATALPDETMVAVPLPAALSKLPDRLIERNEWLRQQIALLRDWLSTARGCQLAAVRERSRDLFAELQARAEQNALTIDDVVAYISGTLVYQIWKVDGDVVKDNDPQFVIDVFTDALLQSRSVQVPQLRNIAKNLQRIKNFGLSYPIEFLALTAPEYCHTRFSRYDEFLVHARMTPREPKTIESYWDVAPFVQWCRSALGLSADEFDLWSFTVDPKVDIPGVPQRLESEWVENVVMNELNLADTTGEIDEEMEHLFDIIETALQRKGQCILYGPPGTGKTFTVKKFVERQSSRSTTGRQKERSVWMMVTGREASFRWDQILSVGGVIDFQLGQVKRNFYAAQPGDIVLCYQGGNSHRGLVGIAQVKESYHRDSDQLLVKGLCEFHDSIGYDSFKDMASYRATQAGSMSNRGTMFGINDEFVEWVADTLRENGDLQAASWLDGQLPSSVYEMVTFHPSYSYEDFVEGYRPLKGEHGIEFEPVSGIFKRLCDRAMDEPDINHYLVIDEINRGNLPKIFGELITLLEMDKRGVKVQLPVSKQSFAVPENVFVIGTMNTADRSIRLMDAAIRRRFAFVECLPRPDVLDTPIPELGVTTGQILERLNQRIVQHLGRDRQIGQSYFMQNGQPVTDIAELRDIFLYEILPLLQEYCFDDYTRLAYVLGEDMVVIDEQIINRDLFDDADLTDFMGALQNLCKSDAI